MYLQKYHLFADISNLYLQFNLGDGSFKSYIKRNIFDFSAWRFTYFQRMSWRDLMKIDVHYLHSMGALLLISRLMSDCAASNTNEMYFEKWKATTLKNPHPLKRGQKKCLRIVPNIRVFKYLGGCFDKSHSFLSHLKQKWFKLHKITHCWCKHASGKGSVSENILKIWNQKRRKWNFISFRRLVSIYITITWTTFSVHVILNLTFNISL